MMIISLEYYEILSENVKQFIFITCNKTVQVCSPNLDCPTNVARTDNTAMKYSLCYTLLHIMVIISLEYYENLSGNVKQLIYNSTQQNCTSLLHKSGLTDASGKGR